MFPENKSKLNQKIFQDKQSPILWIQTITELLNYASL